MESRTPSNGKNRAEYVATKELPAVGVALMEAAISVIPKMLAGGVPIAEVRQSHTFRTLLVAYKNHFGTPRDSRGTKTLKKFLQDVSAIGIIARSRDGSDPFVCDTRDLDRLIFLQKTDNERGPGSDDDGKLLDRLVEWIRRDKRNFIRKLEDAHPLLRSIGVGHTNLKAVSDQLFTMEREIEKQYGIRVEELTPADRIKHVVDFLIERFKKEEGTRELVPETERAENASVVNGAQEQFLKERGLQISMPFKTDRNLVLYFREEGWRQMDGFLFCFNYLICKWLVEESGLSRVFNRVQVVSRKHDKYPKTLHELGLAEHDYLKITGEKFEERTSVGANTVHFTHGTEHGHRYRSTSILGTGTRTDSRKMKSLGMNYVPLPLYYFKENGEAINDQHLEKKEGDFSADLCGTLRVMTQAVRDLETHMLEDARKKPPEKA